MMELGGIKVGVDVDIERSDGRIHSAVVSGLNHETKSVTVEWFENGETKGKEIEVESILALNPDLRSVASENPRNNHMNRKMTLVTSKENGRGGGTALNAAAMRVSRSSAVPRASSQSSQASDELTMGNGENAKKIAGMRQVRKSSCVKEVERIQKQREARRAKAAAIKEQNAANYDTSHPSWEFCAMIKDFCENLEFRPITISDPIYDHQISVAVRKRPMGKHEIAKDDIDVVTVPNKEHIIVHEPKTKVDLTKYLENQQFRFDYGFDETASNEMVYRYTAAPLVQCIFEEGMATCFAYGQTGSGKTHTMGGSFEGKGKQDIRKGIYILSAKDVFKLHSSKFKKLDLSVHSSFFEIYSGKVFDLLNNKQKLRVLEDHKNQVQVVGLQEETVKDVEDVLRLIQHGTSVRTSGQTSANQHSSRSHAVFQLILRKRSTKKLHGKFSLVDLAGNERGADTSSSDRQTRMEGAEINKSLLALKECIRALGKDGRYVPFRASKLTQVLRDSFIGSKSRTCMIATISPGMASCEHTLNTLRYADRVKELGPGGPVEGKPALLVQPMSSVPSGALSPQNSDLALLRNEEDLDDEMLTFHQLVNALQDLEEHVLDQHRLYVEGTERCATEHFRLLGESEAVDYDTDKYTRSLLELIDRQEADLALLKRKVTAYRNELNQEEQISKNLKLKKDIRKKR